jgi:hypothetical protein
MKRKILLTLTVVVVGGLLFWLYNLDPERRWGCFENSQASCANCRSFVGVAIEEYLMDKKDRWLPRGGKTPADSLLLLNPYVKTGIAHHVTSHAMALKLNEYYQKHGTLTYDFMCYRYNEGLRKDDPQDLIVMYYFKPTRWECSYHNMGFLGRVVLDLSLSPSWNFISEAEFQTRQRKTEAYLRDSGRSTTPATVPSETAASDGQ